MTEWLIPALEPRLRHETVTHAVEALSRHDFDTIAVCGVSGLLLGPTVAYLMGKKLAVVRKDQETSHSWRCVEGCWGSKYVIIDDFIASGATVRYIRDMMRNAIGGECIGFYGYYGYYGTYEIQREKCVGLEIPFLRPEHP